MLYCRLKRLPRTSMSGDINKIYVFYGEYGSIPAYLSKTGIAYYPGLDSLIETCRYFLESFLSTFEAKTKIEIIAEALLEHETLDKCAVCELLKLKDSTQYKGN